MKLLFSTVCVVIVSSTIAHAGVDITGCGQDVAGSSAKLLVDLTACPSDSNAITLRDGAKLDLNGFSIASGDTGIFCMQRCTVRGPGEITGTRVGIRTLGQANLKLVVKDVDIHHNTGYGIMHDGGIEMGKTPRVRLKNVTSHDNTGPGMFIFYGRLSGSDVDVLDNTGDGINGLEQFKLKRVTIQRNGRNGLYATYGGGKLIDSLLALNGGPTQTYDLNTAAEPILIRTECGYSNVSGSEVPWGVCAGDE